jgi:hypothetical protein
MPLDLGIIVPRDILGKSNSVYINHYESHSEVEEPGEGAEGFADVGVIPSRLWDHNAW